MKVSEAKTKVCPFMQNMGGVLGVVTIKDEKTLAETLNLNAAANITCICSDCMAWEYTKEETYSDEEYLYFTDIDYDIRYRELLSGEKKCTHSNEWESTYALVSALDEDEKEGYCKRLTNE